MSDSKSESYKFSDVYSEDYYIDAGDVLRFNDDSPHRPLNWSFAKKVLHTILYGILTFAAQLNSTSMSASRFPTLVKKEFGIEREIALLATTLYILGIAFGPMVFAPLSEVYGRKIGVLIPFLGSAVFCFACANTYSVAGLMICRFFAGFCAGAPIVSAGGVLSDIWHPTQRGAAFAVYGCFVANGPSFGPTISSLLMYSEDKPAAWRIPQYFVGLLSLTLFVVSEIVLSETYQPVLLTRAAKKMRIAHGNWALHSQHEEWSLEFSDIVKNHLVRPFAMLATPVVFVIALFASYVYGIFYLIITTMPEAFTMTRNWHGTVSTLPNVALFLGVACGCAANMFWATRYGRKTQQNGGAVIPEERFPLVMALGWLLPCGIFIFGWTCSASIPWVVPCIGIMFIGCGFITIFQGSLNYMVDTYTKYSASVIAANTFLRSVFAASFPLFSKQLFENLGVHWGASLVGFIALGMIPIPFFFYKYGECIRMKNPYKGI